MGDRKGLPNRQPGRPSDRCGAAQDRRVHDRALPHSEVGAALATVRGSGSAPAVRLALELVALTACRVGEVTGAGWSEVNFESTTWVVPATRMKAKREQRVPLSDRALDVLREARQLSGRALVFPSPNPRRLGKQIAGRSLADALRRLGVPAVPHGFRSSFRDWPAEETNHPREVIEAALAHVVSNATEAAYRRTDLFERRRRLMADWAAYLS